MIDLDSVIVQQPDDVATAHVGSQIVCLHIENGRYHSLNTVGTRMFELLEQPTRIRDLLAALASEYEMPAPQATNETLAFLQALVDRKLVRIVTAA